MSNSLSPATLREYLSLDPDSPSGLVWNKSPNPRIKAGTPALTTDSSGYCRGQFRGVSLYAHRVAFVLLHGYWADEVDHIDGNRKNNRGENLRDVSSAENNHNMLGRGYSRVKRQGKYRAHISVNGRQIHLGLFMDPEDARAAYLIAKAEYHPKAGARCFVR
jgi:hypothetical protein